MRPPQSKTIAIATSALVGLSIIILLWWNGMIFFAILFILLALFAGLLIYFYRRRARDEQKDFLNNFMHELKTPLTVMKIAGKVLQTQGIGQDPGRLKKYAGIIKDQAEELESNINRILEVALSEQKKLVLVKEEIDVNAMIGKAISYLQPLIDDRSAIIEFTPGQTPLRIYADGVHIQQVIVTLLDNGLKYAINTPSIKIEVSHNEKMCIISVRDNGIGIEKKHFKDIFRKFYRVPTGNVHNVKGFGIGLNFAKKVVDAHHGKIEVSSEPGIGSAFNIHMPLI
jgi:two-component system, OmpR family, phosphate regulon sensor histidine kinase PhoR